jgi:hypothetical protein
MGKFMGQFIGKFMGQFIGQFAGMLGGRMSDRSKRSVSARKSAAPPAASGESLAAADTGPLGEPIRGRLLALRPALLRLHKCLLDYEKASYEAANKRAVTPGELVRLAMSDPWFDWLRRISETIVQMDALTEDDAARMDDGIAVLQKARGFFRPSGEPTEFQSRYRAALQKDPGSVLAHIEVQRTLFSDS